MCSYTFTPTFIGCTVKQLGKLIFSLYSFRQSDGFVLPENPIIPDLQHGDLFGLEPLSYV